MPGRVIERACGWAYSLFDGLIRAGCGSRVEWLSCRGGIEFRVMFWLNECTKLHLQYEWMESRGLACKRNHRRRPNMKNSGSRHHFFKWTKLISRNGNTISVCAMLFHMNKPSFHSVLCPVRRQSQYVLHLNEKMANDLCAIALIILKVIVKYAWWWSMRWCGWHQITAGDDTIFVARQRQAKNCVWGNWSNAQ